MKTSLKFFAAIVFASTLFVNLSFDSSGHFSLFSKAKAVERIFQPYNATCPNMTVILVCGQGNTTCVPHGTCN